MTIRWRIGVLAIELLLLLGGTWFAIGKPYSNATWFFAGLLAVVINPQLLEPYYPRPVDVIANSIVGLFLFFVTAKSSVRIGWNLLACVMIGALLLSITALILGAGKKEGVLVRLGKAARVTSQPMTARFIYSAIFWLALLEFDPHFSRAFWILAGTWGLVTLISTVNWQNAWISVRGAPAVARVEGMIGPALLLISAPALPAIGKRLSLSARDRETDCVLISRIRRSSDVWGQVLVTNPEACEVLRGCGTVKIKIVDDTEMSVLGTVDVGSTESTLSFAPLKPLEIGKVVAVPSFGGGEPVLYQISSAEVRELTAKGDSHLIVRVKANQVGRFNRSTCRLEQHRWVPELGASVILPNHGIGYGCVGSLEGHIKIGLVLGTEIPIFLDLNVASEGHLAILGMTKMGKTSLTVKIGKSLAVDRRVVVLDQTGEYIGKRRLPRYVGKEEWNDPGLSVHEPPLSYVAADFAYNFLKEVVEIGMKEYLKGEPLPRVLVIDEAHQFIPEPTGLGFQAPGRDSAYKFGITMMQIRKYKIAVILVSQRTAVVAKSALSQCESLIAFRNVDQTGLDYLEAIAGSGVRELLPRLNQGEALCFGPAFSADRAVAIQVDHE